MENIWTACLSATCQRGFILNTDFPIQVQTAIYPVRLFTAVTHHSHEGVNHSVSPPSLPGYLGF